MASAADALHRRSAGLASPQLLGRAGWACLPVGALLLVPSLGCLAGAIHRGLLGFAVPGGQGLGPWAVGQGLGWRWCPPRGPACRLPVGMEGPWQALRCRRCLPLGFRIGHGNFWLWHPIFGGCCALPSASDTPSPDPTNACAKGVPVPPVDNWPAHTTRAWTAAARCASSPRSSLPTA